MLEKIRKYKKACTIAECDENTEANDETISKISGIELKKLDEIRCAIKTEPVSLETYVTDDLCIQDYVEDTSYCSPENSMQKKIEEDDVISLLSRLDKREQDIIKHRFGLEDEKPKTLEQIGNALGFSKERIRQIENIAIQKLRKVDCIQNYHTYIEE